MTMGYILAHVSQWSLGNSVLRGQEGHWPGHFTALCLHRARRGLSLEMGKRKVLYGVESKDPESALAKAGLGAAQTQYEHTE